MARAEQRKRIFRMASNMTESQPVYLPEFLSDKVAEAPESSYGVAKVAVVLKDGRRFTDVEVSWDLKVLRCRGSTAIPFSGQDVIDVERA